MKKIIFLLAVLFFMLGCSNSTTEPIVIENPTIAKLIFPFESSVCNEGTNITPTESTVLFEWEESDHTDNYELVLRNLTTGNITMYQAPEAEIPIVIMRATPYEWYVVSKSNTTSETAESAIWRFYNAGEGIESYAPFPAEIISPIMAEIITTTAGEIILDWNGSDVDDDIVGYDVYFGTTTSPELIQSDLQESILTDVPILSDTIYYWKIITKDSRGNKSDSGLYQFKIS